MTHPFNQSMSFEAEPKKLSIHEMFRALVGFRVETIGRNVSKLDQAVKRMETTHLPDVSRAFQSSFDVLKQAIPMVDANNPIDEQNMLSMSGAVHVEKVQFPVDKNPRLKLAAETDDERVAAARQHLAYIETLDELNHSRSVDNDRFTLAA